MGVEPSSLEPPADAAASGPDDAVDSAWARVLEAWEDDARHGAFVAACKDRGQLGDAARRYRAVVSGEAEVPGGMPKDAQKRLEGVALLAVMLLEAEATPPPERSTVVRALGVLTVVFLFATAAFLLRGGC